MIGIDTNVLVRYILQDDPRQATAATEILEKECSAETPGRVSLVVLAELVWVLTHTYGHDRVTVANVLREVLGTTEFQMENTDVAWRALWDFEKGKGDYADYLTGHTNADVGAVPTVTFDKKAAQSRLFKLVT